MKELVSIVEAMEIHMVRIYKNVRACVCVCVFVLGGSRLGWESFQLNFDDSFAFICVPLFVCVRACNDVSRKSESRASLWSFKYISPNGYNI